MWTKASKAWARTAASALVVFAATVQQGVNRHRRRPWSTVSVVLILATAIGTTTAVFSMVDGVLFQPLPWDRPDQLSRLYSVLPPGRRTVLKWDQGGIKWREWQGLTGAGVFDDVAVWSEPLPLVFGEHKRSLIRALSVSSNFFPMLGITTAAGRGFSHADDSEVTGAILLTHEAWQTRFGGRQDIIGLRIVVSPSFGAGDVPERRTVVGVLPPGLGALDLFLEGRALRHPRGFLPREPPEMFLPLEQVQGVADTRIYSAMARVPQDRVAASITAANTVLAESRDVSVRLEPLIDNQTSRFGPPLFVLFGGAGILLLIACSGVAGLLMSQARTRHHEMAIRRALGASRAVVFLQLAVEQAGAAMAIAAVGVLFAYWLTPALVAWTSGQVPRMATVAISLRVVGFAVVVTVATTVLFSVIPVMALGRAGGSADAGRSMTPLQRRWHRVVVVGEVALTFSLFVGGALCGATALRLAAVPAGFNADRLVAISAQVIGDGFTQASSDTVIQRLEAVPGVVSVAASNAVPFLGQTDVLSSLRLAGSGDEFLAEQAVVTPGYFETIGMRPVRGRSLQSTSDQGLAVVSQEFERRFLGGDGLGRQVVRLVDGRSLRVIGIVPDIRAYHPSDEDRATLYALDGPAGLIFHFMVRVRPGSERLMAQLGEAVAQASPSLILTEATTMDDLIGRSLASERLRGILAMLFVGAAAVLVVVGFYGLAASLVSERQRELGIRAALGATPSDLRAVVVGNSVRTVMWGLALGLPGAIAISSAIAAFVFGVSPTAPAAFIVTGLVLLGVALAAAWPAARRASRIDPAVALREL